MIHSDEWPDIEAELIGWLEGPLWPTVHADTVVGANLEALLRAGKLVVRVGKFAGTSDPVTAYQRVYIEVFALTRTAAMDLARQIEVALAPRVRLVSATIDTVRTDASPHTVPWDNVNIDRVLASYQISSRKGRLS
jgi:hypothetical protein